MADDIVEVAPLAFMRGRTLNESFIVLDEAQNTTPAQMKMFLTRMGYGAKVVITGDITQTDLPRGPAQRPARRARAGRGTSAASAPSSSPTPTSCDIRWSPP